MTFAAPEGYLSQPRQAQQQGGASAMRRPAAVVSSASTASSIADQAQAAADLHRFLHALYAPYVTMPAAHIEVRTFKPLHTIRKGQPNAGPREWFPVGDLGFAAAVKSALRWREEVDVYFGVLPRIRGGGKAKDIRVAGYIWADIDAGNQTFDDAADLLVKAITEKGLPRPHVLVRSGGGLHVYWRLAEVAPCRTPGQQRRVRDVMDRIVRLIGGDLQHAHACPKAFDVARILRLPGTFNLKNPGEPRPVSLLRIDDEPPRKLVWWEAFLPAIPLPAPYVAPDRGGNRRRYTESSSEPRLLPATVEKLTTTAPDGRKHYTMVEVAVAARKQGLDEAAVRNFAEQVAVQAGVNMNDPQQQRHLDAIVAWTIREVVPDPVEHGKVGFHAL